MKRKNVLKKTMALLLALQMVISLAACGNSGGGSDTGKAADTQDAADDTQNTDAADTAGDTADTAETGGSEAGYAMDKNLSGKITIWTWGDYEIKGSSKFNEYYPNIEMEYVQFDSAEYLEKVR